MKIEKRDSFCKIEPKFSSFLKKLLRTNCNSQPEYLASGETMNFAKAFPLWAIASCLSVSAYADIPKKSQKKPSSSQPLVTTTEHGAKGINLPPHVPSPKGYATAEFLYWKAEQEGLEYATFASANINNASNNSAAYRKKNPHYQWKPGMHVSLGYEWSGDPWDVFVDWTYMQGKAHAGASATVGQILDPLWFGLLGPNGVQSGS